MLFVFLSVSRLNMVLLHFLFTNHLSEIQKKCISNSSFCEETIYDTQIVADTKAILEWNEVPKLCPRFGTVFPQFWHTVRDSTAAPQNRVCETFNRENLESRRKLEKINLYLLWQHIRFLGHQSSSKPMMLAQLNVKV